MLRLIKQQEPDLGGMAGKNGKLRSIIPQVGPEGKGTAWGSLTFTDALGRGHWEFFMIAQGSSIGKICKITLNATKKWEGK